MSTAVLDAPKKLRTYDQLAPSRALWLPLLFIAGLACFGFIPSARRDAGLMWSCVGAAGILAAWAAVLLAVSVRAGRDFAVEVLLRKQHYIQACAQGSVLVYWGWYWNQVYDSASLIAAQLVFAYAVDMLLTWSRRRTYVLGFGPFPIIFSINLFLWFKQDWFYLQFLMIAVGLLAKELLRWEKDGRSVHIFNPSSFPLGLFSLVLFVTGSTDITWGREVATTLLRAPHMYLFIFLIGLPGQLLFGVTLMTMTAVATTYLFSLGFFWATGTYYFIDSYIPIAVFLGMQLLFTDPSTSPRTELGRVMFGVLYGLSVVVLYSGPKAFGAPTFYDKLLAVPIMNMMIKGIDTLARSRPLARLDPARLLPALKGRRRYLAFVSVWVLVFSGISAADGVGDTHPGHTVPFWVNACEQGRWNACRTLTTIERRYCADGSGWACNDLGLLLMRSTPTPPEAFSAFQRACGTGFSAGCSNAQALAAGQAPSSRAAPQLIDYPVILREGRGALPDRTPLQFYQRACQQGWRDGCRQACSLGDVSACYAQP